MDVEEEASFSILGTYELNGSMLVLHDGCLDFGLSEYHITNDCGPYGYHITKSEYHKIYDVTLKEPQNYRPEHFFSLSI